MVEEEDKRNERWDEILHSPSGISILLYYINKNIYNILIYISIGWREFYLNGPAGRKRTAKTTSKMAFFVFLHVGWVNVSREHHVK